VKKRALCQRSAARALLAAALLAAACWGEGVTAADRAATIAKVSPALITPTSFAVGSYIIPMDTTYQDTGTLEGFGLVAALLRAGVPVSWVIQEAKTSLATPDFTTSAVDFSTGVAITNTGYVAGPFVIDSSNAAQAAPVITTWQARLPQTTVHIATLGFSGTVRRQLIAAPRIAVLVDGFEGIAFNYLNAAGIPDSAGQPWPTGGGPPYAGYPDVVTDAQVAGAVAGGPPDGVLFRPDGTPAFCQLTSMHYNAPPIDEAVREVRLWLTNHPTHAFMQCQAAQTFENSVNGAFLTSGGGIYNDSATVPTAKVLTFDSPFTQFDGAFSPANGALQSIGLNAGASYYSAAAPLIDSTGSATIFSNDVLLTGFLDNLAGNGKVTYLSGHQYSIAEPISASSSTNGTRLFLNSLFESDCATAAGSPQIALTKSAPAATNASSITFTFAFSNTGAGSADAATLTDTLAAGLVFSSATGPYTVAGTTVTWSLGNLATGASGNVTVTAAVSADGTYTNRGTLRFNNGQTPVTQTSNTTSTVRDTARPTVAIKSKPANPTNQTTAAFSFTSSKPAGATFQCALDGGAAAACNSGSASYSGLASGSHGFSVTATDPAGNVSAPATWSWTVVSPAPPPPAIASPADGAFVPDNRPVIAGTAQPNASIAVLIDGVQAGSTAADASGNWSFTVAAGGALADGSHTVSAIQTDSFGTSSAPSGTNRFTVQNTPPTTAITASPGSRTFDPSARFAFSSNRPEATFECSLDGAAFATCANPYVPAPLTADSHRLVVRAKDRFGAVDPNPPSYAWTVAVHQNAFVGGGCASADGGGFTAALALLAFAFLLRRRSIRV
jgi:uncharacterized repeat protein (TIGR01451 family)/uncharacterized protein (TIGR03382 family)